MNRLRTLRILATAFVLTAGIGGVMSCRDDTGPSAVCNMGPYTFDSNVDRCRASNGQFAPDACCGR